MGTGASKSNSQGKKKAENKQFKPARSKLRAAATLTKMNPVQGLCPLSECAFHSMPYLCSFEICFTTWIATSNPSYNCLAHRKEGVLGELINGGAYIRGEVEAHKCR